ncbi:MAG TPA: TolC family protein, partial [Humisphaera sp.]
MRFRSSVILQGSSLLVASAILTGCAVDESKEVALYRQVLDGPNAKKVAYEAGAPLSLSQALLLANQHNERLEVAGEDYVQALVDKDRAAATFFPTVTLVPSFSKADASTDAGGRRLNGGLTNDPTELAGRSSNATGDSNWDTPVNANWNVFRGFRDLATLRRAASQIDRFKALLLDLKATVMLDVATAYYQVLRSEATVRVLENSSRLQDARVAEMTARDRVGSARKLDVAQARAQAANTRAQLAAARADVRNARTLLAFLTNAPVADAPLVDRLGVPAGATDVAEALARAETGRQNLVAARQATLAAAQGVQGAVGEYYPSVTINFNYYLSRDSSPEDSLWNGLVSVNVPLFTAGRIHADVRTALSQLRQAKSGEQLARREVEQQVRQAIENLRASQARLTELRVAVEAAQQALDVAEGNYQAGSGIYLERLVAQDQLLNAQLQYATEDFTLKLNYLNVLRATGELRDPPAEGQAATLPAELFRPTTRPATGPAPRAARCGGGAAEGAG